jgi:cob(I)alamin adenosyltransferase
MQDLLLIRVEDEQKELRTTLRDIQTQLMLIHNDLAALKARMTVVYAGGTAIFGAMVWALQYLLTHS